MRLPIGFVVEGVGEFHAYQPIVRKGITAAHGQIPIANAFGNGTIRKSLEDKLIEVVKTGYPVVVIVTLDVRDALADPRYDHCADVRRDLQDRADRWLDEMRRHGTLVPLPERIVVVLQAPAFEAWLISDFDGLQAYGLKRGAERYSCEDVDTGIRQPKRWLEQNLSGGFNKRPQEVVRVVKALHPIRMERSSRSFRKFWKEVLNGYKDWARITGGVYVENRL